MPRGKVPVQVAQVPVEVPQVPLPVEFPAVSVEVPVEPPAVPVCGSGDIPLSPCVLCIRGGTRWLASSTARKTTIHVVQ